MSETHIPSYLPEHMKQWYGIPDHTLFEFLDCFCMSALFHFPEIIGEMTEDGKANSRIAMKKLQDKTLFRDMAMPAVSKLQVGDVLIYGAESCNVQSQNKIIYAAHSYVFVGGARVLSKPAYGIHRYGEANIMSLNDPYRFDVKQHGNPTTRLRRKI